MNERPTHRSTLIGACLAILALVGCGEEPAPPSVPMKVITTAGGAEMVCLPAGEFAMGSASGEPDERPMRTVSLDSFCIDKTEVTGTVRGSCGEEPIAVQERPTPRGERELARGRGLLQPAFHERRA